MEPGVPFALLGGVQLVLVAAFTALAGAAALRRSLAGFVVALGALVIAAAEIRTALQLGVVSSDPLMLLRAAGYLLLVVGLVTGGLGRRVLPSRLHGVVIPLAATGSATAFAGFAAVAAGLAAAFDRRGRSGPLLGGGFVLLGIGNGLATTADSDSGAAAVLALRGAGGLLLLAGLTVLAQASLLSKVVAAILAGVLAMAVAAVGVVGNVVVSSYDRQTREIVEEAANGRVDALETLKNNAMSRAVILDALCESASSCASFVQQAYSEDRGGFVVSVTGDGRSQAYGGRSPLTPTELLGIGRLPVVTTVLTGEGTTRVERLSGIVRLAGSPSSLAVIGVGVNRASVRVNGPQSVPRRALVYGFRLDGDYTRSDIDTGGFGLTFLTGDPLRVVATNRNERVADQIETIAGADRAAEPFTVGSQGVNPTVRVVPLTDSELNPVGLLAVSRDPGPALKTERDALRLLLVTSMLALIVVAVGALVLGRRTVEPVRRLTLAAERVAAGDLTATTGLTTRDEVGTLSRTFDGMTTSLARLTGDLRESADRLETVLASMSDGLLATDAAGVVNAVNRAALELLGLVAEDVLGEPLAVVADVRDVAGDSLADPTLRLRDEAGEVHRPDGSNVPVRVAIAALQGDGDTGVVMVLRDTTREREVERMKTEFLSNVSHELRTPLTPIRGYAEILVSKPGLDPAMVGTFATTIRDEAVKMNRVVDLLVDVAVMEAGRVAVSPRAVPVRDLLDLRLAAWVKRAPDRSTDFKRRVAAKLPAVYVDPTWVGKALDEFLDNAVKYTQPGTSITLVATWSPDHTRVRVAVKDAGPGIAESDQHTLFTSFEQVDGSATRRVGGLGLGLSFVRRLAEDAGYPLTVSSKLGKGAEFSLDLPTG